MAKVILTIDTNVCYDMLDETRQRHHDAIDLLNICETNESISLQVTSRILTEVNNKESQQSIKLDILPTLDSFVGCVFRVGSAIIGHDHIISSEEASEKENLMKLLFPGASRDRNSYTNKCRDVDHLMGHKRSGAHFFLTNDLEIIKKSKELEQDFKIVAMSVEDYLKKYGFLYRINKPTIAR